ncbi:MAG: tetraacyldisaccharide 4'-kinase [Bacteroidales bacterium]|nr:tetraacyldisaccharide 4'-kinase [Bacteroidales bacterium]
MYKLITTIRNLLFDKNIIKSKKYKDVFVLCVGNLRVGGTGKTPMVEYLLTNLQDKFPTAVVSLGYKRKTKGLKEITPQDDYLSVGDEPKQMSTKFPKVKFFVNKDRNEAIDYIIKQYPNIQLVILDDAYQYRKTTPTKTILLTEYSRPFFEDKLLPYGRLRERQKEKRRADYIVVTKSPNFVLENGNFILEQRNKETENLNKEIRQRINVIKKGIDILPYQKLYFSTIKYSDSLLKLKKKNILLVTGIDNPRPLENYLHSFCDVKKVLKYPDHYNYLDKDILHIKKLSKEYSALIVTTQKDAQRLQNRGIDFYVQDIETQVDNNFIKDIEDDIRKHFRG